MFASPLAPLRNPVGFGATDFIELGFALVLTGLVLTGLAGRRGGMRFRARTGWLMLFFAALPVALRLLLLPHHPVPVPDIYDEFGHLLVADTLRHGRLANPPHAFSRFFETFFVLQRPTYSSIYPIGNGLALALGWMVFGTPWAGVLLCMAAFCSLCYWMLRGWTSPGWALVGGLLAVFEFGPLNQWTNGYWGGGFSAAAGCLVFGALPRLRERARVRDGVLLGVGFGMHVLSRPYESIFLAVSMVLFFAGDFRRLPWRPLAAGGLAVLAALSVTALQNQRVTGEWTKLPYALSQEQYGVPAALTFQTAPVPHVPLTPRQDLDYRMQKNFHPGPETFTDYFARLGFRMRYYRFYFYAPLYPALLVFLLTIRTYRRAWVALTCLVFALGINLFPAFQFHYLAAVACLFVLMSVQGLERLAQVRYGAEASRLMVLFCVAQFVFWYGLHLAEGNEYAETLRGYDVWDSVNHGNPERRIEVARQLEKTPGKLVVFVRYWPQHVFQDEWVYNGAGIDEARVVWARDLGDAENRKLLRYYPDRKAMLLEPDARPPALDVYSPEEAAAGESAGESAAGESAPVPKREGKRPLIEFEDVK